MTQQFYQIEILNESIDFDGVTYAKSVKVVEFYAQKKIKERYLGFIDDEFIYRLIDAKQELNFNNCYIKDFSISEYKRTRHLDTKEIISLKAINAKNAFFDCDAFTDFSYVNFTEDIDCWPLDSLTALIWQQLWHVSPQILSWISRPDY